MAPVEIAGGEPHVVGGTGSRGFGSTMRGAAISGGCMRRRTSQVGRRRSMPRRVGGSGDRGARDDRRAGDPPAADPELDGAEVEREQRTRVRAGPRRLAACRHTIRRAAAESGWTSTRAASACSTATQKGRSGSRACTSSARNTSWARSARNPPYQLMHCHEVIDRVEVAQNPGGAYDDRARDARWHCYQSGWTSPTDDARWMVFVKQRGASRVARRAIIERPVERMHLDLVLPVAVGWGVDTKPLGNSEPPPGYRGDEARKSSRRRKSACPPGHTRRHAERDHGNLVRRKRLQSLWHRRRADVRARLSRRPDVHQGQRQGRDHRQTASVGTVRLACEGLPDAANPHAAAVEPRGAGVHAQRAGTQAQDDLAIRLRNGGERTYETPAGQTAVLSQSVSGLGQDLDRSPKPGSEAIFHRLAGLCR